MISTKACVGLFQGSSFPTVSRGKRVVESSYGGRTVHAVHRNASVDEGRGSEKPRMKNRGDERETGRRTSCRGHESTIYGAMTRERTNDLQALRHFYTYEARLCFRFGARISLE